MKGGQPAFGEFRAVVTERTEPYHSVTSNLILIYWVGWVYHMGSDFCPNAHTNRTDRGFQHSGNQHRDLWEWGYLLRLGDKSKSCLLARPLCTVTWDQLSACCWTSITSSQGAVLLLSNLGCWHKWPMALLITPNKSCFLL